MSNKPQSAAVPAFLARLGVKESEWQYALKSGFRVLMRPGWDWRVRFYAALMQQSHGFKRELAVLQVRGDVRGDPPKLVPLTPGGIIKVLHDAAVEAFRESGAEPTEEQRESFKIDRTNARRLLRSMEEDDGCIVRVRANCDPRRLIAEGQ